MKSGVIVAIAVVVLLAVAGGYFYINSPDSGDGVVCAADVQECSDGSFVSRNPNNNCEFFTCSAGNNQANQTNASQTQSRTLYIEIKDFAFSSPDFDFDTLTLHVNPGDTVVWTNKDSVQHTVTSDSGSELNSQYLSKGSSYSHTFITEGEFDYHCKPHPYMKGKIIVQRIIYG